MKRSAIRLEDIAAWDTLVAACQRAARGKRNRDDVRRFQRTLFGEIESLRCQILDETVPLGKMTTFSIRDPKPRIIHAPCFRERVLHHALIAHAGPVLDRALVDDTFACREGKGTIAAVRRAQHHARRHAWFAQVDMRQYFASIDHEVLLRCLARRFKDRGVLRLMERIIRSFQVEPGKGLPIGALTSQVFANTYLSGVDRLVLEDCRVGGVVRYMDDLVWWEDDKTAVRAVLDRVREYAEGELGLTIKDPVRIGRSRDGLAFCGFRILPGAILLSRRRKRRYARIRKQAEADFAAGRIGAEALQAGYGSALALTVQCDATAWRREHLRRHPLDAAVAAV